MGRHKQALLRIAGVILIAATVLCVLYMPEWVERYEAYLRAENTPAPVCQHGPPSHCYRAEANHG